MTTKRNRSFMIEDNQIKKLIEIRNEKGLRQVNIYEKAGQLLGRAVKHLRNLKKDEANKVIESFETNHQAHAVNEIMSGDELPVQIIETPKPLITQIQKQVKESEPEQIKVVEIPKKKTWAQIVEERKKAKENKDA